MMRIAFPLFHLLSLAILSFILTVAECPTIAAFPANKPYPGKPVIPVFPHLPVPPNEKAVANYDWPTLQVFLPPRAKANGTSCVICAGGAYIFEWLPGEAYPEALWLNHLGVTAFVLKYRLPKGGLPPSGTPWPLQDVRRAVQIVRDNAKKWHLDPHRVGVMGFSAGGSLASLAGTHWLAGNSEAANPLNHFSTRPDFLILGYPVISMRAGITHVGSRRALLGRHPRHSQVLYFSSELHVNPTTPPTFIFCARDDHAVSNANSILFYQALRRNHVACEFKHFNKGGHGFGMGNPKLDSGHWTADCARWLAKMGWLKPARTH